MILRRAFPWLGLAVCAWLVSTGAARAQAIERNLPPAVAAPPKPAPLAVLPPETDDRPIGPALRALVVLDAETPALTTASPGVDLGRIPRLRASTAALRRFLGRPISRKLIAEVEAEITRAYRRQGRPFVSVSTPEQEIGGGVLQVRVIEFHLGAKTAKGAAPRDAGYVESRIRARPGQPLDATALSQDLDWLNRFPFRRTEAVFTPGQGLGASDLILQTTDLKPWSAYVGYANSGSPLTGTDRYFAGAQAVLPWLHDAYAAYQGTASDDVLFGDRRLFDAGPDPRYLSHAGRLVIPTLPRQDLELSVSYVRTNQPVQDFVIRQTTYEATLAYRSALSNLWRPLAGEAAAGVELKRQTSDTRFGGIGVTSGNFNLLQVTLSYADQESDRLAAPAARSPSASAPAMWTTATPARRWTTYRTAAPPRRDTPISPPW